LLPEELLDDGGGDIRPRRYAPLVLRIDMVPRSARSMRHVRELNRAVLPIDFPDPIQELLYKTGRFRLGVDAGHLAQGCQFVDALGRRRSKSVHKMRDGLVPEATQGSI